MADEQHKNQTLKIYLKSKISSQLRRKKIFRLEFLICQNNWLVLTCGQI